MNPDVEPESRTPPVNYRLREGESIDTQAAAKLIGSHPVTVRRLMMTDPRFPRPFRVGTALRFLRSEIEAWVAGGGSPGPTVTRAGRVVQVRG